MSLRFSKKSAADHHLAQPLEDFNVNSCTFESYTQIQWVSGSMCFLNHRASVPHPAINGPSNRYQQYPAINDQQPAYSSHHGGRAESLLEQGGDSHETITTYHNDDGPITALSCQIMSNYVKLRVHHWKVFPIFLGVI